MVNKKEEEEGLNYYFFCRVILSKYMNYGVGIEKDVDRVNFKKLKRGSRDV
jgi:hypothetical protein